MSLRLGRDDPLLGIDHRGPAYIGQAAQIGQLGLQFLAAPLAQVVGQAALQQRQGLLAVLAPVAQLGAAAQGQFDAQQQQAEEQGEQAEQQRQ